MQVLLAHQQIHGCLAACRGQHASQPTVIIDVFLDMLAQNRVVVSKLPVVDGVECPPGNDRNGCERYLTALGGTRAHRARKNISIGKRDGVHLLDKIDPVTGLASDLIPLALDGVPVNFAFDALEILPEGRKPVADIAETCMRDSGMAVR